MAVPLEGSRTIGQALRGVKTGSRLPIRGEAGPPARQVGLVGVLAPGSRRDSSRPAPQPIAGRRPTSRSPRTPPALTRPGRSRAPTVRLDIALAGRPGG